MCDGTSSNTAITVPGETRAVSTAERYLPGAAEWRRRSLRFPLGPAAAARNCRSTDRVGAASANVLPDRGGRGTQEPRLINARKISVNARACQHMVEHCAIQRLGTGWKIRRRRGQLQTSVESVHGNDVVVDVRRVIVWRTGSIVFGAQVEIVEDLLAVCACGGSSVLGEFVGLGRNVVHAPVRKGRRRVVHGYDETSRTPRGMRPR